jgi:hypothetical protein
LLYAQSMAIGQRRLELWMRIAQIERGMPLKA